MASWGSDVVQADDTPLLLSCSGNMGGACSSADTGGGGEDLMQDFVRLHMMSILHPFAEHARELQAQVRQLADDASCACEAAARQGSRLDEHEQKIAGLSANSAQCVERLDNQQVEFAAAKREKARLDGNHEMTKAAVAKTKDTMNALSSTVDELQQALQQNVGQTTSLQDSLADTDKRLMEYIETRLNKQGKVCKELSEKQAEMAKSLQQAITLGQSTNVSLKKFTTSVDHRRSEETEGLGSLGSRLTDLEARAADWDQDLKKQAGDLKANDRELLHLKTWADQLTDVKKLTSQQSETTSSLKEQLRRVAKAEDDVVELRHHMVSEKQVQISDMCKIDEKLTKTAADIGRLKENQRIHTEMIGTAGQRLDASDNDGRKLRERVETAEHATQGFAAWRNDVKKTLEDHESTLHATSSDMRRAHECIEDSKGSFNRLKAEIGSERESLMKLSSRVDMCCKFFNGFGKGLQDAHRQVVAGESGMLPPKMSLANSALPMIPQTPKTPRGGRQPSPRRAVAMGGPPQYAS